MVFNRLPRFKRVLPEFPIELTDRDLAIMRLVHAHRFLSSAHITTMIGGSGQQLLRRLQLLYHHGFLERPRAQLEYYERGGSRPIVYGLGNKGAVLLSKEFGVAVSAVDWNEKNRSVGRIYLQHALLVSDFMIKTEHACRRNGIRFLSHADLFRGQSDTVSAAFRWRVNINNAVTLGVMPDRVFGIQRSDGQTQQDRSYFFLEADRGTMPVLRNSLSQTSMYRKFLAYGATWTKSIHQTQFGFHRFRVLTVTKSAARVSSLLDACSKLERGQGLFLFTDIESLNKGGPLLPVWRTTRKDEPVALLDER